jgi:8-oxo-dGTP diphosphatase
MFTEALIAKLRDLYNSGLVGERGRPNAEAIINELIAANNRPRVGVGAIIFKGKANEPPQILMEKRKHRYGHGDGEWSLPGGWMENGETWIDTAKREAFEEVGIRAKDGRFITAVTTQFRPDLHCVTGFVVLKNWAIDPAFAAEHDGPFPREPGKTEALAWIPIQDIVSGKLSPVFGSVVRLFRELKNLNYSFEIDELHR